VKVVMHVDGKTMRGNERQCLLLAVELMRRGHSVAVSLLEDGPVRDAYRAAGVETVIIRPGGDADLWNALRFAAWLRRERVDAVLLTSWKRLFIAGWAAKVAGVPRVVLRVGGIHRKRSRISLARQRLALTRWIDAVYVNSREVGEWIRGAFPLRPGVVVEVPNGIVPISRPVPVARASLGGHDGTLLLAAVGGLEPRKGFDLLIRALASSGVDGVRLVIVGEGAEGDALRALAESLGVADRIAWLGQRDDVPAVLAACDAFVLSSRSEGMAVAMLEAMALEVPVLAADAGGVQEVLAARDDRGPAGWIVRSRDADALAGGLRDLAAALRPDPAEARRRAAEARWRLDHWFTVQRMMDGVEAVLRG
jgi:glycosyltransferase involved in cell wall biosynthesis